jgi:hypothetical protein
MHHPRTGLVMPKRKKRNLIKMLKSLNVFAMKPALADLQRLK